MLCTEKPNRVVTTALKGASTKPEAEHPFTASSHSVASETVMAIGPERAPGDNAVDVKLLDSRPAHGVALR